MQCSTRSIFVVSKTRRARTWYSLSWKTRKPSILFEILRVDWMLNCRVIRFVGLNYLLITTWDHCLTKNLFKFNNMWEYEIFKVSGRNTRMSLTSTSCPFCWHGTNMAVHMTNKYLQHLNQNKNKKTWQIQRLAPKNLSWALKLEKKCFYKII